MVEVTSIILIYIRIMHEQIFPIPLLKMLMEILLHEILMRPIAKLKLIMLGFILAFRLELLWEIKEFMLMVCLIISA